MNVDGALAVIALLVLGLLFYGPWQQICTAWGRQIVFEKRDAIFDLAAQGKLEFGSFEYRTVRHSLELTIKYAHELSFPRFLFTKWALLRTGKIAESDLLKAISAIENHEVQMEVDLLVRQAHIALIAMMLAKSPFTVALTAIWLGMKHLHSQAPDFVAKQAAPLGEMIQYEVEHVSEDKHEELFAAA